MARSRREIAGDETIHYVSARKEREKQHGSTVIQPPLTPMIDVVFQLLLFFLLACQFRMAEGQIPANLPDISGPVIRTSLKIDPIRVTLRPTGRDNTGVLIEVEYTDVALTSAEELYGYLKRMIDRYGQDSKDEVPVIIRPVGNVRWAHVVNAFNQAIRAEFKHIGFVPSG